MTRLEICDKDDSQRMLTSTASKLTFISKTHTHTYTQPHTVLMAIVQVNVDKPFVHLIPQFQSFLF